MSCIDCPNQSGYAPVRRHLYWEVSSAATAFSLNCPQRLSVSLLHSRVRTTNKFSSNGQHFRFMIFLWHVLQTEMFIMSRSRQKSKMNEVNTNTISTTYRCTSYSADIGQATLELKKDTPVLIKSDNYNRILIHNIQLGLVNCKGTRGISIICLPTDVWFIKRAQWNRTRKNGCHCVLQSRC